MTAPAVDLDHSWRQFSISIIAVLAVSIIGVVLVVAGFSALGTIGLARGEQDRRASEVARFIARAAFVPVSLGDTETLAKVVDIYAEDRDVVSVNVAAPDGKVLVRRDFHPAESARDLAVGTRPVSAPQELRTSAAGDETLAVVQVVLSGTRVRSAVRRSLTWIMLASFVLAAGAVLLDLKLISRMTGRLKDLLDQARRAEELARSNADLEQFAYVASHDLQEPLRKIVSFSELLRQRYSGKLDDEAARMFDLVVDGGLRMRNLIQDLLSYARVQSQAHPLVRVDTGMLVREALEAVEESAKEAGADIKIDSDMPEVLGDGSQLRQVFQNLLSNAIKFRRPDAAPKISVGARREGVYWRISISDNGIGIAPQYQKQAFEMMRRLHPRGKYPGTGIGLALCKRIVERHGGRIWLESQPELGTTIHFTLPDGAPPEPQG
jgi:signal transduction histidine kinase